MELPLMAITKMYLYRMVKIVFILCLLVRYSTYRNIFKEIQSEKNFLYICAASLVSSSGSISQSFTRVTSELVYL